MNFNIQRPLSEMRDVLSQYRLGSPRTRKGYISVLKIVIKDLFFLKIMFNSFKEIDFKEIGALIEHWKTRNIKSVTISSRLAIIRKYTILLNHLIVIPDNKSLGLTRIKNKIEHLQPLSYDNIMKEIYNPFVRLIINLQALFGLTKNEAIQFRIQSYGEMKRHYFIAKSISHDNRDRLIEVRFPEQEQIIEALSKIICPNLSLSDKYDLQSMSKIYASEMLLSKCPSNYPFRFIYAKKLFNYFISHENLSEKAAIDKTALEMGIVEKRIMKKWIHYE